MNAEVMLESAFGALAEGVAVHDPCGRLIFACPVAARIFGLAQERANAVAADGPQWAGGKEDGGPIPIDELQALASLRTGRPLRDVVLRFENPAPAGRWILSHVRAIENPENPWCGCVISTFIDITAQQPVEAGQRQAELHDVSQKLLFAVAAGHVGAWEFNPATLGFRWNKEMFEMYGMPVQDSVPESIWRDRILPEDLPGIQKKLYRALFGKNSGPVGFRVRHADGILRHFLVTAAIAFDHTRQPLCIAGLALDQTGQLRIEQALQLGQNRPRDAKKACSEVL